MADLSDVTAYLVLASEAAVYPNGTAQPSVAGIGVRIFEGWPGPDKLDRDLAGVDDSNPPKLRALGNVAEVSVYPMSGNTATPYQILNNTYTIREPVYGLTVSIVDDVIQISGDPTDGEYVTVVLDHSFVASRSGATRAEIITNLVSDISVQYPDVSSNDTSITIPFRFAQIVRQGAKAIQGRVTHRQKHSIMVTVWAPTPATRNSLSSAIDVALKNELVVAMPDTSQALIVYNRTNVFDDKQMASAYRRDLIYDVDYATVEQFPAYVITTVNTTIAKPNNSAIAHAIT